MTDQSKTPAAPVADAPVDDNPHGWPRFRSMSGEPALIALIAGGHTIGVTHEEIGTPLPPMFHKAAAQFNCFPLAIAASMPKETSPRHTLDKQKLLIAAIEQMSAEVVAKPELANQLFTGDGRPKANILEGRIGLPVSAGERDQAWDFYTEGAD